MIGRAARVFGVYVILLVFCSADSAVKTPAEGRISIKVTGLRNGKGQVLASLFDKADGFPADGGKAFRLDTVKITEAREVMVVFTNVPAGRYAVAVCHDENSNSRMDTGFFGKPKEGIAVYKETEMKFKPPSFKDAVFAFTNSFLEAEIVIKYY